jgi:hypothetical protein
MRVPPPPPLNFVQEVQRNFLTRGASDLAAISVLRHVEAVTKPVFLIVDPPRDRLIESQNATFRSRLKRLGRTVDYLEVGSGFAQNLPGERARVFRRMEEFFNLNLYDYDVKVGETKEVK